MTTHKEQLRLKRHRKIRKRLSGTAERPRLVVSRSNRADNAQLIDDVSGKTLAACTELKGKKDSATTVGKKIAEEAKKLKIDAAVFDRNGYKYHGRIKMVADGAREGGLKI